MRTKYGHEMNVQARMDFHAKKWRVLQSFFAVFCLPAVYFHALLKQTISGKIRRTEKNGRNRGLPTA